MRNKNTMLQHPPRQRHLEFPTVLYGAAYYNEYMPGDQDARLQKDIAMMKAAGLNVVRMGESPCPRPSGRWCGCGVAG